MEPSDERPVLVYIQSESAWHTASWDIKHKRWFVELRCGSLTAVYPPEDVIEWMKLPPVAGAARPTHPRAGTSPCTQPSLPGGSA